MSKRKDWWQVPRVVFQPDTYRGLQSGTEQIVNAIIPTLGPFPRIVMFDQTISNQGRIPELLDDGGTIARRIIELPDRDADMGAMIARHMLWTLREKQGDGTATAAVLYKTVFDEGLRYLAAGGNAMRLRTFLEQGLRLIAAEIDAQAFMLEGKRDLAKLATAVARDEDLGDMLGEIFDIIGEYGRLEVRNADGRHYEREYVGGMYWPDSGYHTKSFINNQQKQRCELEDAAIILSDVDIVDPRDLIPSLRECVRHGIKSLLVICKEFSEESQAMLMMNKTQKRIGVEVITAKTPGLALDSQMIALRDIAAWVGGEPYAKAAGDSIKNIKFEHMGRARRLWVDDRNIHIDGGLGDPRVLRTYLANLRKAHDNMREFEDRELMQKRIGMLMGGSAVLRIGGNTKTEVEYNKEMARRAISAMRGAMRQGVVPGGGVAFLQCKPVLQAKLDAATSAEEIAAYRILMHAMEAPTRTLMQNAGFEPGEKMAHLVHAPEGSGFDVASGEVVNMREAGILDVTTVVKAALHSAISSAAMTLTTDVLVHRPAGPVSAVTT